MTAPTVLIVPGLRDAVSHHWQTLLEADLRERGQPTASVPPMGREALGCEARVAAIEHAVQSLAGPVVLVAHSGGCLMVAHWARRSTRPILGALLAAPPDFERPMPEGYPSLASLDDHGWLPVPRERLPFRSIVGTSRNDPLAAQERAAQLADAWGSEQVDLGEVGHLNPASGFGPWPRALDFIAQLSAHA
ncbi:RBBP9/YdeN family alpha/beta hydrolase [Acidovorax cavernicola]|uniref:Serine hydrolase family protein n=1 Tax=Acidovorax cavernicola TaxID=1675792 RepID=A0A9X8D345_9BURK|nr:alpha/beta hydrolase [Acidovorax cavernicola]RIX77770.1 serine hydrolase family protein [Acidovorax cavernicola]